MDVKGRFVIIPDVHNQIAKVEEILHLVEYKVERVIFLGDYFDSFGDLNCMNEATARWLAHHLTHSRNRIFLWGNHDLHYAHPRVDAIRGSGFSSGKKEVIREYLKKEHWDKLKFFHFIPEANLLCSHAGIHGEEFNLEKLEDDVKRIPFSLNVVTESDRTVSPMVCPGRGRGGWEDHGGITWQDFDTEFVHVKGVNQVVGHSPHKKAIEEVTENGEFDIALDTRLNTILLFDANTKVRKIMEV